MDSGKKIVCATCKRHYKTKMALAQHVRDSHSKPVASKQQRRPRTRQTAMTDRRTTSGRDYVTSYNLSSKQNVGWKLWSITVTPSSFEETRLGMESDLWARWRPKKFQLHMNCAGASTTFGQITTAWDPDPTTDWNSGSATEKVRRIMSLPHSVTMELRGTKTFNIPCEAARKWYQTTGELDQTSHGAIIALVTGYVGGFTSVLTVNCTLDWTVEWEGAELRPPSTVISEYIKPDAGWENLFTTSDGSFDATILTFKMHSGGAMVPFSSAKHGVVYTTEGTKTQVYYYNSANQNVLCKYFAKVDGYSTPGLLLFASKADAQDYIRNGDLAKAIKYTKAGEYTTPVIPTFVSATSSVAVSNNSERRIQELENQVSRLISLLSDPDNEPRHLVSEKYAKANLTLLTDMEHNVNRMSVNDEVRPLGTLEHPTVVLPIPLREDMSSSFSLCSVCTEASNPIQK